MATVPTRRELFEELVNYLVEKLGYKKDEITEQTSLVNDLGMDSLDVTEYILHLQDKLEDCGVPREKSEIPDTTAQTWQNMGDILDYMIKIISETAGTTTKI